MSITIEELQGILGEIKVFPSNRIPINWSPCDGKLLPISEYPQLYSIIGATFGGNGQTTFALPDLRGRTVIGQGSWYTYEQYRIGQKGGQEYVTLTEAEIGVHNHDFSTAYAEGTFILRTPNVSFLAELFSRSKWYTINGFAPAPTQADDTVMLNENSISNTGGGGAHDNMMPYLVLTYCMATKGEYPIYD